MPPVVTGAPQSSFAWTCTLTASPAATLKLDRNTGEMNSRTSFVAPQTAAGLASLDVVGAPEVGMEAIWMVCALPSLKASVNVHCRRFGVNALTLACTVIALVCPCAIVPAAGLGKHQFCPSSVTYVEVKPICLPVELKIVSC